MRLGHIVICTGFRNPALTAKMISTLDVVSGGRAELGIGAGWKQEEWEAFGYDFPSTRERLATLGEHLEIITRMLDSTAPMSAPRYEGQYARGGRCHQPAQADAATARAGDGRRQRTRGDLATGGPATPMSSTSTA